MLHPKVLADLLDAEVAVARERLGSRVTGIERHGASVDLAYISLDGRHVRVRFDGSRFDAEPFRVAVVDDHGEVLPHESWPPGLSLGAHPVHGRPFACLRGTYEYHTHPSHLEDSWDRYRPTLRLADLAHHILTKGGRP